MPNTLAHIGIHGLLLRMGCRWPWILIYAGLLIPDIPWIALRVLRKILTGIAPGTLVLYATAQASLLFCMIACGLLALSLRPRRRSFVILLSGCALHLGLDALQIKWSNGVLLAAPFNWTLGSYGLGWPEHWIFSLLTLLGFVLFAASLASKHRPTLSTVTVHPPARWGLCGVAALLLLYILAPICMIRGALDADIYHSRSLAERPRSETHLFAFDRATVHPSEQGPQARLYTGETVTLEGLSVDGPTLVTFKGHFTPQGTLRVVDYHMHRGRMRDVSVMAGLLCMAVYFGVALYAAQRRGRPLSFS